MNKVIIKDSVVIKNFYGIDNFDDEIIKIMSKKYKNNCSKKDGYVISVDKLVKVLSSKISSINCNLIFDVKVEMSTLLPKVNDVYTGTVCLVFEKGIFLDIDNVFKALISYESLNKDNYTFNSIYENFTNKDKDAIYVGSVLKIRLKGVKYSKITKVNNVSKTVFNCFGDIEP